MRSVTHLLVVLALAALATGCAPATPAPPAGPGATASSGHALGITGTVAKPLSLTAAALKAMPVVTLKAEHPKSGVQEYAGVRLNALLDQAQPQASAANVTLMAGDGFTANISLADLRKCTDCLLAFNADKLDAVMPGQASSTWVRGVVRIDVK